MAFAAPPDPVPLDTFHASAERASSSEIEQLAARALTDPILKVVFEAIGGYVMVLDTHRQIIVANDVLLEMLNGEVENSALGLRPGEAFHCVNATRGPHGCGTSIQCRHCGIVATFLEAQRAKRPIDGQCTISHCLSGVPRLVDFRLRVSPLELAGTEVFVAVFQDVSAIKWSELQQRMFLHDLANVTMGLRGWGDLLAEETTLEAATKIVELVRQLSDSLSSQRLLIQCESGEFQLDAKALPRDDLSRDLKDLFAPIAAARNCRFVVVQEPGPWQLSTDRVLLLRVLGNLIKNAFEASSTGHDVTVTFRPTETATEFVVHNVGTIPQNAADQLFKRRFSTKGRSRGLGIYAVQVFGEQYLGGHVEFESSLERGTLFRFTLPNQPPLTNPWQRE